MCLHVPCQLDPSLCACDELTDWSPQHVLDELGKVGYGLFYKHHVQVYADTATKHAALMREVYFLTQAWRAGADASSPPEFATLDDCAGQLERAAKLPSHEDEDD